MFPSLPVFTVLFVLIILHKSETVAKTEKVWFHLSHKWTRGGEGGLANAPAGSKLLTSQHNHLCFLPLFCFISTMDANRRVKMGKALA